MFQSSAANKSTSLAASNYILFNVTSFFGGTRHWAALSHLVIYTDNYMKPVHKAPNAH
jgi:hypothetical protein